ncbi:MAG: tetratricopeptide repeat protein [Xenococcaceae cyanobacterium]
MKNNLPIYGFATRMMSPEIMEAIFIQRQKFVAHLIESIKESTFTKNKHYDLLIGMRGIGKTFTTALIFHRLRKIEELEDKLVIAWLQEEEYVSSFLDLLLKIFQVLKQDYSEEYKTELDSQVENLYKLSADDALRQAERILKEFIGEKTLLLMMENLDEIFKGLGDIGQKQFRAYIQNSNFITILATSQSLFDGIKSREYPFYGFFNPHYLEKLTKEEAQSLLLKIAQLENNTELETFIRSPKGKDRIAAIHHLAGGNHRVYVIFSQFLTRDSLDELVQPVMQTLDELTPYYQAKMQWLSPQQRKIVELLCDRRNAIPVKEIAQRCFITHQTASSQLKDLREKGYVTAESLGRASYYELQEPLMRICLEVKKQRGEPIKLFIDFLRIWYTEKELNERLQVLPDNCLEREYINHALAAKAKSMSVDSNDEFAATQDWVNRDLEKVIAGNLEFDYDKAVALIPDNDSAWYNRGIALRKLGRYEEAIASYDKALEINPKNRFVLFNPIKEFIKIIWESTTDVNIWKSRLKTLVEIYDKHQVISALSKGIVDNIPNLMSDMVSDKAAHTWLEIWQEIAGDKPELAIALRFLKTAVEYKETKGDRKVLLQLAKEERELLEPLLKKN